MKYGQINHVENSMDEDRRLMCAAHNCPNVWSVDGGNGRLCSAHAWAEPKHWTRITDGLFTGVGRKSQEVEPTPAPPLTRAEKQAIAAKFAQLLKQPKDYKQWAHDLKAKETKGFALSLLQKKMWREVLKEQA